MEHVLMDERGNTTKSTYDQKSRLSYVLFAVMLIMGAGGIAFFYNFANRPAPAATFTPFLSSPQAGFSGSCNIIPDAEDFAPCSTGYVPTADDNVLRCPSGYGNLEVLKVKDGETGKTNYRDLALLRHYCKGMDNCKVNVADLRAADDGMPLEDNDIVIEEDVIEIEPEAIIEDVAGVDSNGHVLMKHHGHHHHSHPGQVKIHYECEKTEDPFAPLADLFSELMSGAFDEPEAIPVEEEVDTTEEYLTGDAEETPVLFLSKKHGHGCNKGLKNIAQDWDAGTVCGTVAEEMTLSCDPNRAGARIFVMAVKPKLPHQHGAGGADANVDTGVIEDTTSSVENEPFLAKHGHHGHNHGHKNKKGKGKNSEKKQMGFQLTDVCASQGGECTTTLNVDLQTALAQNPLIDETTPMHVKYMCSYSHQDN